MDIVKALRKESNELHQVLPLKTPYTFNVTTNNYCDFKCKYCQQSLPAEETIKILGKKKHLSFELFKQAVDGMARFPDQFKIFNFCGTGETLLTPDLAKMIAYAQESGVVERTNIVTNANSLTRELSDSLISAGLGSLRISIQGLDAAKYKEVSDVEIDFSRFLDQIKYFYNHRGNCEVHIKIIDIALGDYTEQDFYNMFGDYCTSIAIERFIPMIGISYDKVNAKEQGVTVHGFEKKEVKVCFSAFYALTLDMDGNIAPCCMPIVPLYLGNVSKTTIYDMWNSEKLKQFWQTQLKDRNRIPLCKQCSRPTNAAQPGDIIDDYADEVLMKIMGS